MKKCLFTLIFLACGDSGENAIYSTSFASTSDLQRWQNVTDDALTTDAGRHVLRIGGGCIQPAAALELPVTGDGRYRLRCDARLTEGLNGHLELYVNAQPPVQILVDSHTWLHYVSEDVVAHRGDTLVVAIYIGGIVFNEMMLDNLTIESD